MFSVLSMRLKVQNSIRIVSLAMCLALVALAMPAGLSAQAGRTASSAQPPSRIIKGIAVEGNATADATTIIALSGLRVGAEIKGQEMFPAAIRALWRRNQFADVQIVVDKTTDDGLYLKIIVTEFPRIANFQIEGYDSFSEDKIIEAVGKQVGEIITQNDVYLIRKKIKALYEDDGQSFARVDVQLREADRDNYVTVAISIEEGVNYYLKDISFQGNSAFTNEQLASAFEENKTTSWWQFWSSSKFDPKKFQEKDKPALRNFYRKNGYLDAEILSDSIRYDEANEAAYLTINVREGKQYFIRNIKFDGNLVFPSSVLQRRLNFFSGNVYDVERFDRNLYGNEDQTDVLSVYMNNGYLGARLEKEETRVAEDSLDITIKVIEFKQFTIRKVSIEGNTKTYDKVIRRELFTRPGDFFNRAAVIRSIRQLGVLNYFNPEALQPKIQPVDNTQVDITYKVEERSSDTFNASVGYAGVFGLTGSIGVTLTNFSLTEPLRGGAGQILNFNWEFGGAGLGRSLQTFQLSFTEPWLFDEPTTVGFTIFDTRQIFNFDIRRTGFNFNIGRRFRWPDDFFRGNWILRVSRNDVKGAGSNQFFLEGVNSEFSVIQTFSRISLDNVIFPTEGSQVALTSTFAMGALGIGSVDYFKNEFVLDFYNPLLRINDMNRLALYLGANLGYVTSFKDNSAVPPNELYIMGGNGLGGIAVTPLRGYPDPQQRIGIGPRDEAGNILRAQVQSRYVAELRFALSLNPIPIYVLAFAEAGNTWLNINQTDPFDLKRSAGLGLRLLLNPIGLIGFDYGYGFDKVTDQSLAPHGWQFHFQFGR